MYREIIKRNNDKKVVNYYSKKDDKWKNVMSATDKLVKYFIILKKDMKVN
jgi:viroplasmin and RNaseH domain-containing protein